MIPRAGAPPVLVDVWPNSADLNQVLYDPALYAAADYVVTSEAVRGRYEADPRRYAAQVSLYRWLDSHAVREAGFRSGAGVTGPGIVVYRLPEAERRALRAEGTGLDPLWWARYVPMSARAELDRVLAPGVEDRGALRDSLGNPAPWVGALGNVFMQQFAPFAFAMSAHLAELSRPREAREFAAAILAIEPDHAPARAIFDAMGRRE